MTIGAFVCGNGLGWTSPALPGIQDVQQITHVVDDDEASWIGSFFTMGCFIAVLVCIQSNNIFSIMKTKL